MSRAPIATHPSTHPPIQAIHPAHLVRSFVRSSSPRAAAATRSGKSPFSVPPPVASVRSPIPASSSPPLYIGRSLESRRNSADALSPPHPVLSLSRASILIESEERRWRSGGTACMPERNDDGATERSGD